MIPPRSLLFVPADRAERLVPKAAAAGPDAVIVDLEDAVAPAAKEAGRAGLRSAAEALRDYTGPVFVRVNAWGTGLLLGDLTAAFDGPVDAVVLPKVAEAADVVALDRVLTEYEHSAGVPVGDTEIVPLAETAAAFVDFRLVCAASPRVRRTVCVTAVGEGPPGDLHRALGVDASRAEVESQYLDLHLVGAARASGVEQVLAGPPLALRDPVGARRTFAAAARRGATGAMVIHPAQVAAANEVFVPSADEIDAALRVVTALADGDGAVALDGLMVDIAHGRAGLAVLERARAHGVALTIPAVSWAEPGGGGR